MDDHALRKRAVAEMHLRRWPPIPVPCLIVQWVLMVDEAAATTELEAIEAYAAEVQPVENPSHRAGSLTDRIRFSWEQHSEGSSLTLLDPVAGPEAYLNPDADDELRVALDWARQLPGKIVRSTRLWIARDDRDAEQLLDRMELRRDEMVSGLIDGAIRFWSDFRLREDGFGRLIVAANGAETGDLTRAVQRLQELGNYRNRALLGLPVAREHWPRLDRAEIRLRELADRVANTGERDDELMAALSDLSLDLAATSTAIGFRMDATKAYAQLVEERLLQLKAEPVPGFASLDDFTQRRFRPAMNTCAATTERVRELAVRAEQLSSLLRARIETRIENQNAELLHSMERSVEVRKILDALGVEINCVAPLGASPADIARIGAADFNIVLYPEIGSEAARWLAKTFAQPTVRSVPIGVGATREFIAEIAAMAGTDPAAALGDNASRMPWWSRSVDSTYLTGKRVFVFGDATHAVAAARIAQEELGFEVCGLGCYNREFARELREAAALYGVEPLITDDHLAVEEAIAAASPELVLGTQMERHIAKRLGLPCAVISAPVHVQDFPARHSPQMGFEGANVIFDSWVHPLVMGLEEHLLTMFREDFEFSDGAGASHLHTQAPSPASPAPEPVIANDAEPGSLWTAEAERELKKIPFFVRGKARRNTELYAAEQGRDAIDLATLYDAKAHHAR